MKRYQNYGGNSNVSLYEYGVDYITVMISTGAQYTYNYKSAGVEHVETMKKLADSGSGLNSYIMNHVKKLYA